MLDSKWFSCNRDFTTSPESMQRTQKRNDTHHISIVWNRVTDISCFCLDYAYSAGKMWHICSGRRVFEKCTTLVYSNREFLGQVVSSSCGNIINGMEVLGSAWMWMCNWQLSCDDDQGRRAW
jgi:hypothetical protein